MNDERRMMSPEEAREEATKMQEKMQDNPKLSHSEAEKSIEREKSDILQRSVDSLERIVASRELQVDNKATTGFLRAGYWKLASASYELGLADAIEELTRQKAAKKFYLSHDVNHLAFSNFDWLKKSAPLEPTESFEKVAKLTKILGKLVSLDYEIQQSWIQAAERYEYLGELEKQHEMEARIKTEGKDHGKFLLNTGDQEEFKKTLEEWENATKDFTPSMTIEEIIEEAREEINHLKSKAE